MHGTNVAAQFRGRPVARGLVVAAALMFSAFGSSLAMADPEPAPTPTAPTGEVPAPTPNTEAPTPVETAPAAPVPARSLCGVIRGNKTQIDDTTWPLKVATKTEGWDWSDGDVAEARTRITGQLPALLSNLQQGLSAHGGDETAEAVGEAIASGKELVSTVTNNGDGGDTSGALGAFDKALDDSLRSCVGQ